MNTQAVNESRFLSSRIAWGAIFAGAIVAFVSILILNSLGVAIGMSTGDGQLGTGTAVWAVAVALISLFLGGAVMSYLEEHETKQEAIMHGVVLWGVLFFGLIMLAMTGIQMGLNFFMGAATSLSQQMSLSELMQMARELGLTSEQLAILQDRIGNAQIPTAQNAWWSVAGMLVSLAAVVFGAVGGEKAKETQFYLKSLKRAA